MCQVFIGLLHGGYRNSAKPSRRRKFSSTGGFKGLQKLNVLIFFLLFHLFDVDFTVVVDFIVPKGDSIDVAGAGKNFEVSLCHASKLIHKVSIIVLFEAFQGCHTLFHQN